jgi:hypothetical protein
MPPCMFSVYKIKDIIDLVADKHRRNPPAVYRQKHIPLAHALFWATDRVLDIAWREDTGP